MLLCICQLARSPTGLRVLREQELEEACLCAPCFRKVLHTVSILDSPMERCGHRLWIGCAIGDDDLTTRMHNDHPPYGRIRGFFFCTAKEAGKVDSTCSSFTSTFFTEETRHGGKAEGREKVQSGLLLQSWVPIPRNRQVETPRMSSFGDQRMISDRLQLHLKQAHRPKLSLSPSFF